MSFVSHTAEFTKGAQAKVFFCQVGITTCMYIGLLLNCLCLHQLRCIASGFRPAHKRRSQVKVVCVNTACIIDVERVRPTANNRCRDQSKPNRVMCRIRATGERRNRATCRRAHVSETETEIANFNTQKMAGNCTAIFCVVNNLCEQ
jgi:hypothetical protein